MWMVPPEWMCRQHLLGEHVELHMFVGAIKKHKNIDGFVKNGLCEPDMILNRHAELVEEMAKRGYNHKSPLTEEQFVWAGDPIGCVSVAGNILELARRCPRCHRRLKEGGWHLEE